ncbi:uncharacterized protein BO72DRAFT_494421 [Aspergillus fijiensis CBS 313.89]|uniref:Uncharacterized protein n=1 Tax=Aspergillus fijiensis CBS 313.89 TaxID=1448319 RepID=A0A8G1RUC9_9EURO|nr:uncharacterized protein BO72DRAFT_494421 [Aspergillus fijiensis CBS 313.89]RAK79063.1 hypothetical protein BO72DRAFT_494421 [Aspergillus fijiensis CBS 313.89]
MSHTLKWGLLISIALWWKLIGADKSFIYSQVGELRAISVGVEANKSHFVYPLILNAVQALGMIQMLLHAMLYVVQPQKIAPVA